MALIEIQNFQSEVITGAQVKITSYDKGKEFLELPMYVTYDTGIEGTFEAKKGILTLAGAGRLEDYEYALSQIIYNTRTTGDKALEASLIDHSGAKKKSAVPISVLPGPTPPEIKLAETGMVYFKGDGKSPVSEGTTIDVPDGETIQSVRLDFVDDRFVANEDVLAFDAATFNVANSSNLAAEFDSATGSLVLTGTATEENWTAAVQKITYESTAANVTEAPRYLTLTATDGSGNPSSRYLMIQVTQLKRPILVVFRWEIPVKGRPSNYSSNGRNRNV